MPEYPFAPFAGRLSPELAALAVRAPLVRVRMPFAGTVWLVTGHEQVRTVLTDVRFTRAIGSQLGALGPQGEAWRHRSLGMDGPPHIDLRRLASRAFTPRRIQAVEPRIQQLTDELLGALVATGPPGDLVAGLAFPLPMGMICFLLGVPEEDRERFAAWSDVIMTTSGHPPAEIAAANAELTDYLRRRVAAKRREPGADLLSAWLAAADGSDELAEAEILHLAVAVLVAGHETTVNAIGNALWFLLGNPAEADRLRADPALLPAAVEELLRLQQPSDVFRIQIATAEVELAGVRIRAGEAVMAMPFVANRDVTVFDGADAYDPGRPGGDHLAFGYGAHYCLGAALARAELRIVLGGVLARFPGLRPAVPLESLGWKQDVMVSGLVELPVTW